MWWYLKLNHRGCCWNFEAGCCLFALELAGWAYIVTGDNSDAKGNKEKMLLSRYILVDERLWAKLFVAPLRYPTMLNHRCPPLSPCADHRCARLNVCTITHKAISTTLCSARLFWRFRLLPRQRYRSNCRILKRVIVCHASASRNKRPVTKPKHVQTSTSSGQYERRNKVHHRARKLVFAHSSQYIHTLKLNVLLIARTKSVLFRRSEVRRKSRKCRSWLSIP